MRIASVIGLPADNAAEYQRLHSQVWPEVIRRLQESHVSNYSIYRFGNLLFSYMEYDGEDLERDMAEVASDPVTRRWWALCEPLQEPITGRAADEWWMRLPEVFHMP